MYLTNPLYSVKTLYKKVVACMKTATGKISSKKESVLQNSNTIWTTKVS